jgi:hypothetical protein
MSYIFCYWDDPVDYRHDRETKNNNSLSSIEQKQETPVDDSGEHERGRYSVNDQKETSNP